MLSGEVFGGLAGGVGVIVPGEGGAEPDGGVGAEPELGEGAGVGGDVGGLAEELEGGLAGGLGVGDDAVDDFLAVDVSGVLMRAGEGVVDGELQEVDDAEDEGEDDERGPVVLGGDAPAGAEAAEQELEEVEAEKEGDAALRQRKRSWC